MVVKDGADDAGPSDGVCVSSGDVLLIDGEGRSFPQKCGREDAKQDLLPTNRENDAWLPVPRPGVQVPT